MAPRPMPSRAFEPCLDDELVGAFHAAAADGIVRRDEVLIADLVTASRQLGVRGGGHLPGVCVHARGVRTGGELAEHLLLTPMPQR